MFRKNKKTFVYFGQREGKIDLLRMELEDSFIKGDLDLLVINETEMESTVPRVWN